MAQQFDAVPISTQPVLTTVPALARLVGLLPPQVEPDKKKRNVTFTRAAVAAWLGAQSLVATTLAAAQATAPDVAGTVYAIASLPEASQQPGYTGATWNGSAAQQVVLVQAIPGADGTGVRYANHGLLLTAAGTQAVLVSVAAGTYAAEAVNVYDMPAAKRVAVADAISQAVAGGGQAVLAETDAAYFGKVFKDNRTPTAPYRFSCDQEANINTGATEWYWNRTRIQ